MPDELNGAPLLEVRDLHVSFDLERSTVYAVQGLNLTVARGAPRRRGRERVGQERLGPVGDADGALPGQDHRGEIVFAGEDVTSSRGRGCAIRGAQIGMIPQSPMTSLNPVLTVEAHFQEVLAAHLG